MKKYTAFLLLLWSVFASAQLPTVANLRNQFYASVDDYDSAWSLYDKLENSDVLSKPLYHGYKGMANLLMAKHSWMPWNKISYFNTGTGYLDEAVNGDPSSVELRFLRLCVQQNAPGFLGYYDNIDDDYKIVIDYLKKVSATNMDRDLVSRIVNYLMNECGDCNSAENLALLQKIKSQYLS